MHLLPADRSDHRVIDAERIGQISVSDLAAATGINDATVSQTLRHLRASSPITALLAGQ